MNIFQKFMHSRIHAFMPYSTKAKREEEIIFTELIVNCPKQNQHLCQYTLPNS